MCLFVWAGASYVPLRFGAVHVSVVVARIDVYASYVRFLCAMR